MNLKLPEKEKVSKKRVSIYITVAVICILAVIVVVCVQILGNDVVDNMFGLNKIVKRTEQEEAELKADFEDIFDNKIKLENENDYYSLKMDKDKAIVYTEYSKKEKTDKYEINLNVPYINIANSEAQSFNKNISGTFEAKAEEIIKGLDEDVIFTVKYKASIEGNILSLIIYSDLKQNTSAQRVIIQTFDFDLENEKEISLEDTVKIYELNKSEVQDKINQDIQKIQKRYDELKALGYNVFTRDARNEIYKIENIDQFFIYNNNIYIIFAYGNSQFTSERDIVII